MMITSYNYTKLGFCTFLIMNNEPLAIGFWCYGKQGIRWNGLTCSNIDLLKR